MKQSITQTLTLTLTVRDGAGGLGRGALIPRSPRGSGKLELNLKNKHSKSEPNGAH